MAKRKIMYNRVKTLFGLSVTLLNHGPGK